MTKIEYTSIQLDDCLSSDYAANLAAFVQMQTGSVCGIWCGRMLAADQRKLFGRYFGKGQIVINGSDETIKVYVKVCFGTDSDMRHSVTWRELNATADHVPMNDAAPAGAVCCERISAETITAGPIELRGRERMLAFWEAADDAATVLCAAPSCAPADYAMPGSYTVAAPRRAWISFKRVGGLYHWRIGRTGGSFYRSRPRSEWEHAFNAERWLLRCVAAATFAASLVGCAF